MDPSRVFVGPSNGTGGAELPLRVAFVITRLNIGGPALHVQLLASRLDRARYEVTVYTGRPSAREGDIRALLPTAGVRIVEVPGLRREISPWHDLRALAALLGAFRRERPDVVHTHMAKAGFIGRIAGRAAGTRIVLHTFHGNVLRGYFGWSRSTVFNWIERLLTTISTRIVALSARQQQELIRLRIASPMKIEQIPLGIDLQPFLAPAEGRLRAELGLAPDVELIGTVARLTHIKGIDVLIDAAVLVTERRPRVRFVVVGDGPSRDVLLQRARDLGLAETVHFVGWRGDLSSVYADLDVVVLSSRNEGTPMSVIEAMAAARAVVATSVGGVPDLMPDGTGVLVPPEDPRSLAAAIDRLLCQPAERAALGAAAREHVVRWHDAATMVDRHDRLYRRLAHDVGR